MLVSKHLMGRLESAGVRHVFGVPGDYVLDFYNELWNNPKIQVVGNTDENHSGFAADAYARVNGVGCVVVTYSVGASKVINAVQCAFAERSPMIVISGAPGMNERNEGFLPHHMVGSFNSQKNLFENITCASVVLDNPSTAGYEIDKALEAMHYYKRPIYIELPRDVAKMSLSYDVYRQGTPTTPPTDQENLKEALNEVMAWLGEARSPAILAGVELARYDLGELLIKFAERHDIPVATTLLSKSVINERHRLFAGIYQGPTSAELTRKTIEDSDCLLMFGVMLTDFCLCFRPARFKKRQVVSVSLSDLQIRNHTYTNIQFGDFCNSLFRLNILRQGGDALELPAVKQKSTFEPKDVPVTTERLFQKIDSVLNRKMAIVADIGDSLFGAESLTVHHSHHFLSPAFYASMGSAIPGALGVQMAKPDVRPIVIVGDGAFQMSCTELSTIIEHKLNPIVFVLNNDGYTTERCLMDGGFNDIRRWNYERIVDMLGGGQGRRVTTELELQKAVEEAIDSKELFVINVVVGRNDVSAGLRRLTDALSKRI